MRKHRKWRSYTAASATALTLLLATLPALAQVAPSTTAAPQGLPTDPKALVQLAIPVNSLAGEGSKPWRLKAAFHTFRPAVGISDEENKQGMYEELWVSDYEYRQSYADGEYLQTVYGTPNGKVISGGWGFVLGEVRELHEYFQPAADLRLYAEGHDLAFDPASVHAGESACIRSVVERPKGSRTAPQTYRFCFGSDLRLMRFSINGDDDFLILFRKPFSFRDRTVPGEIELRRQGLARVEAYLESIEAADPVDEAELQPPPDAVPDDSEPVHANPPGQVNLPPGVAAKLIRSVSAPVYPSEAKAAGISGTVVLGGKIGVDGLMRDVVVISGPKELRQAAINAVAQWQYRPYLLNGKAIEAVTNVNVVFRLGK